MNQVDRQKLRDAAIAAVNGTRARSGVHRAALGGDWQVQTSNSFRRIGAWGDGDVLCGTKHPRDGHPDLLAAPGVLDYVVAAQPRVVIALLDDLAAAEDKLREAEILCARIDDVDKKLDVMARVTASLGTALTELLAAPDGVAAAKARDLIDQIMVSIVEIRR